MSVCPSLCMYVHERTRTDKGSPLLSQLTTEVMSVGCEKKCNYVAGR